MKIVVLSDTHIPERAKDLPPQIYEDLKSANLILHAGDMTSIDFLKKLQKISEVKAVVGNMDDIGLKKMLPQKQLIKIGKLCIGLIHGWGNPQDLTESVQKEFLKEKPDIIIFGHSHQALKAQKNGVILLNPGSPTDKIFSKSNSYGIISIDSEDKINIKIVEI